MATTYYDIMIIGAGPAGITAALYGVQLGLKVVVFGDIPGGSTYMIQSLGNFPGFPGGIPGAQFGIQAFQQAQQEGAFFTLTRLQKLDREEKLFVGLDAKGGKYAAAGAIIATGRIPKRLAVKNAGLKGVHFCSLCDGPQYRGRNATLAVVGSDDAAGQHAVTLARIAKKVLLVSRSRKFQMNATLTGRIDQLANITLLAATEVIAYEGQDAVEAIVTENQQNGRKTIPVDGVFLAVGWRPNIKILELPVEKTAAGYLKIDHKFMTSMPGLFAAGDVCEKDMYQVLAACSDGARAAKYCVDFLEEQQQQQ
jgi:thioredoxin reductase (NADPH)